MKNTALKIPAIGTAIRVDWLDSTAEEGWHYVHEGEPIDAGLRLPMITRGPLVRADATSITLAFTEAPASPEDLTVGYMSYLTIPKGCVVKIQVIP